MKKCIPFLMGLLSIFTTMQAKEKQTMVLIETSMGDIKICLYNETPAHRDNFINLVESGYYEDLLFHRVIKDFMIQGGDPESRNAPASKHLGAGGPDYTIPAEFVYPQYFHKRGALSAARQADQVNPQKASSGSQFYIVWGQVYSELQLKQMEDQKLSQQKNAYFQKLAMEREDIIRQMYMSQDQAGLQRMQDQLAAMTEEYFKDKPSAAFTEEQRKAYTTVGGTPFLDGEYTVFGEVVEGLDVVEKIQNVRTSSTDRPLSDISMKMRIVQE